MISIDFLYTIIGTPLGYIMWPIYLLLQNFGWAILIFTVIVKIAMLPLQIKQQKNMAFSQLFAPKVKEIQQKYRNNRDKQAEEMQKLQAQGYNPAGGCGPLILTMVILFGVIDVVYKPMTHMEHLSSADISNVITVAKETEYTKIFLNEYNKQDKEIIDKYLSGDKNIIYVTAENGQLTHEYKDNEEYKTKYEEKDPSADQLTIEQVNKYGSLFVTSDDAYTQFTGDNSRLTAETKNRLAAVAGKYKGMQKELLALQVYEQYPDTFKSCDESVLSNDVKGRLASLSHNMMFCGLNFGSTPKLAFEPLIIIPIFAFVLSLVQTVLSQYLNKKNNPEMANAGGAGMKVMLYLMPLFSLWISFSVPAGVGFYWGVNYALGIVQSLVMQKLYSPEKLRAEAEEKMKERKLKERQVTTTAVVTDADTGEEKTVTKTETLSQKEINRRKLAAARKADAEKYGEEYHEEDDD